MSGWFRATLVVYPSKSYCRVNGGRKLTPFPDTGLVSGDADMSLPVELKERMVSTTRWTRPHTGISHPSNLHTRIVVLAAVHTGLPA